MRVLEPLEKKHYAALYEIGKCVDRRVSGSTFKEFCEILQEWGGWAVVHGEEIVGCVGLSDMRPSVDVVIHCFVADKWQRRWMWKEGLRKVFGTLFDDMNLQRVSGYSIDGLTDTAGLFLERLGFKKEGIRRNAHSFNGTVRDVSIYGMLRDECRWRDGNGS